MRTKTATCSHTRGDITTATRRRILQHPTLQSEGIRKLLETEGVHTTCSAIRGVRTKMRAGGIQLLFVDARHFQSSPAERSAIEKAIRVNPSQKSTQLKESMDVQGHRTTVHRIKYIRRRMRKKGIPVPSIKPGPAKGTIRHAIEAAIRDDPLEKTAILEKRYAPRGILQLFNVSDMYAGRCAGKGN